MQDLLVPNFVFLLYNPLASEEPDSEEKLRVLSTNTKGSFPKHIPSVVLSKDTALQTVLTLVAL